MMIERARVCYDFSLIAMRVSLPGFEDKGRAVISHRPWSANWTEPTRQISGVKNIQQSFHQMHGL